MGITQEIRKIVRKREKELEIVKIAKKTEANMEAWKNKHKRESFFDKFWKWFR